MKETVVIFFAAILFLSIIPSYTFAEKQTDNDKPPFVTSIKKLKEPKAVKLSDGRIAEKQVFIFYKDEPDTKTANMKGGNPDKKKDKGNQCFDVFGKNAKWRTTEDYLINTGNGDGLSEDFVNTRIESSIDTWDSEVSFEIFGTGSIDNTAPLIIGDDNNVVIFGTILDSNRNIAENVIAATIIVGFFNLPPKFNEILEWDIIFNDAAFEFGDVGPTSETVNVVTDVMDLQNIASHELGHALGLAHPPEACEEETMHGTADSGETKKRTLNKGDLFGLKKLY